MLSCAYFTCIGPADYDASLMYVTLLATTNSMTTAELRITIQDEDILERDEDFTIMLDTMETRVNIANSTSVVIVNDDGEWILRNTYQRPSLLWSKQNHLYQLFLFHLVLLIDLETREIEADERNGTVTLRLIVNGTSEFDYNIDLIINYVLTGEWTLIFDSIFNDWFYIGFLMCMCKHYVR